MRFFILFACLFLELNAAVRKNPEETPRKMLVLTIAKSGTHLLYNVLMEITDRSIWWLQPGEIVYEKKLEQLLDPSNKTIALQHLMPEFDLIRKKDPERYAIVLLIRDPRDILVSQKEWMNEDKLWPWWTPNWLLKKFNNLPDEQQMRYLIAEFPDYFYSMRYYMRESLKWMQDSDALICRFEDLVGPEGGGDRQRQEETIYKIAEHLGFSLDREDAARIALKIYGNSITFSKGQIGRWQTTFSEEDKEVFKKTLGKELIEMGYADDMDW